MITFASRRLLLVIHPFNKMCLNNTNHVSCHGTPFTYDQLWSTAMSHYQPCSTSISQHWHDQPWSDTSTTIIRHDEQKNHWPLSCWWLDQYHTVSSTSKPYVAQRRSNMDGCHVSGALPDRCEPLVPISRSPARSNLHLSDAACCSGPC